MNRFDPISALLFVFVVIVILAIVFPNTINR